MQPMVNADIPPSLHPPPLNTQVMGRGPNEYTRRTTRQDTGGSVSSYRAIKPVDLKDFPAFEPVPSLIWAVSYSRAVARWYAPVEEHLRDQHRYQLTLLTGSFQGALEVGVSFMRTHKEEFIRLCPGVAPFLDQLLMEEGPSSTQNPHTQSAMQLIREFRETEAMLEQMADPVNPAGRLGRTQAFLYPSGPHQVIKAWLLLVDTYFCIPTEPELAIWTVGMKQGMANALFPKVSAVEAPKQFAARVMQAHFLFSRFKAHSEVHEVLASNPPMKVLRQGIRPELQGWILHAQVVHNTKDMTSGKQVAMIVDHLQRVHEASQANLLRQQVGSDNLLQTLSLNPVPTTAPTQAIIPGNRQGKGPWQPRFDRTVSANAACAPTLITISQEEEQGVVGEGEPPEAQSPPVRYYEANTEGEPTQGAIAAAAVPIRYAPRREWVEKWWLSNWGPRKPGIPTEALPTP